MSLISKNAEVLFTECENGFNIKKFDTKEGKKKKLIWKKKVLFITKEEAEKKNYGVMGPAQGQNLYHCLYMASKYAKDFAERVCAYSVNTSPKNKEFKIEVTLRRGYFFFIPSNNPAWVWSSNFPFSRNSRTLLTPK